MADAVSIQIDDERVRAELERLNLASGGRARPTMVKIARQMKTNTQLRFDRQEDAEGQKWKPSLRVQKHGGQTLQVTRRLRDSFQAEADDHSASLSTNVPYAAAHHFGVDKEVQVRAHRAMRRGGNKSRGTVSVKSFEVRAHKMHMRLPERGFMPFGEEDKTDILEILAEDLKARAGGSAE